MSLKQRAVQCSAYIPASQYVPVYSRPHRTSNGRWHEELSPITPKQDFDDTYNNRSQSVQEAVKLWLESSPKSVIAPLYRSRSPSSASPPSHRVSLEQAAPMASGSPGVSLDRDKNSDQVQDDGTGALASMQKSGAKSSESGHLPNSAVESRKNGVIPCSDLPQKSRAEKEEPSAVAGKKGANKSLPKERGGRGGSRESSEEEFGFLYEKQSSGSSEESDVSSRTLSREFDSMLAAAAIATEASEEITPVETVESPHVLLKPPRGLEKAVSSEGDENGDRPAGIVEKADRIADGENANLGEISSADAPKFEKRRSGDGTDANNAAALPVGVRAIKHATFGDGASSRQTDESGGAVVLSKTRSNASQLGIKSDRQTGSIGSGRTSRFRPGDLKREASVASSYDSRIDGSRRRMQPSYNSDGSAASAPNHGNPQHMYESFRPHVDGGRVHRSTWRTNVTPAESLKGRSAKTNGKHVNPAKAALEQARWNRQQAKAAAWEDAKNAEFMNRYKRAERKIYAWEERKISRASLALSKLELELEQKRAKATEKTLYEVAMARRKADDMRRNAEAKRVEQAAKAAVQAQVLRVSRSPLSCFCS